MEGKPAHKSQAVLSELALPNDANGLGAVLGGKIMHLVDIAGAIAAARHCRGFVVTASCDHMDFLQPVHIGELIILRATVNRAFRTSMEVGVKVFAEDLRGGETRHVASAYLTFVALDDARHPVPVPPLVPENQEDQRRYEQAGARRAYRLAHRNRNAGASAPRETTGRST